jgi:hypothetical protein
MVSQVILRASWTRTMLMVAVLAVLLTCALAVTALAAEPSAAPVGLLAGGDPRSEGGGPGLVGSPLVMLLGVMALGLVTALATAALARLRAR